MSTPTVRVQVGFGATWQTPDHEISWTDITDMVRTEDGIVADRGRQTPHEHPSTGELTLVLIDPDRRFDPFNAASPHAGQLVPGVPIRVWGVFEVDPVERITEAGDVRITEAGDVRVLEDDVEPVVIWRGHVTGWPRRYADQRPSQVHVPIDAFDGLDRLARARLPGSVVERHTLESQPILYWPLTDSVGTEAVELIRGADGIYHQDIAGTRGALLPYAPAQAMQASQPTPSNPVGQRMIRPQALSLDDEVTIRCWFRFTETPDDGAATLMLLQRPDEPAPLTASGEPGLGVGVGTGLSGGVMVGWIGGQNIGAGSFLFSSSTGPAAYAATDRQAHQLVCTVDGSTDTLEVWIDGEKLELDVPITDVEMTDVIAAVRLAGAGWRITAGEGIPLPGRPTVGHFAIWDRILTAEEIAADYAAGVDPWGGDLPGDRIDRVLDLIGWPAARRNIAAGWHRLGPAAWDPGAPPIDHLRVVEATEAGRLFVDRNGDVTFHDWLHPFVDEAAPALTLGDPTPVVDVQVDWDDDWVRNRIELSLQGGASIATADEDSIGAVGEVVMSRDVAPRTIAAGRWLADWLLALSKDPQPRVPAVELDLGTLDVDDQITALRADLGTRIALRLAEPTGTPTTLDLIIEGVEHSIRPDEWRIRWFVAPAPAVEPFIPEVDPGLLVVPTSADDGTIFSTAVSYADAREGDGDLVVDDVAEVLMVGQADDPMVAQTFVLFDVGQWRSIPGPLDMFFSGVELVAEVSSTSEVTSSATRLNSSGTSYSATRSGTGITSNSSLLVGQLRWGSSDWEIGEVFASFDLAAIPAHATITAAALHLPVTQARIDTPFTIEVRRGSWEGSPSWVPGASLGDLDLLGSVAAPDPAETVEVTPEAGFFTDMLDARTNEEPWQLVIHSSRTRTNNAPTSGDPFEYVFMGRPYLVVETDSGATFMVEARVHDWSPPLAEEHFVPGSELGDLDLAGAGESVASGELVIDGTPEFFGQVADLVAGDADPTVGVVIAAEDQRVDEAPTGAQLMMTAGRELGTATAWRLRLVPKEA